MNSLLCFDHFCRFEREMLTARVLKQSYAAAEQHGSDVDHDFVNEAECDELLRSVCTLYYNIPISGRFFRFFVRSFNAVNENIHTSIGYIFGQAV